ncbi:MAG: hypothetical protein R3Y36_05380 [Spirochaetales bacterium]
MVFVSDTLIAQLLVLCLLLPVTLRPLSKNVKYLDAPAFFAPVALFLAVLQLFIFGIHILSLLITILALSVTITNRKSLHRFVHKLFVDRYTLGFCVISYIQGLVAIAVIVLCIIFQPLPIQNNAAVATVYSGSFASGFEKKTNPLTLSDLIIYEYLPTPQENSFVLLNPLVIFLNDIGTQAADSALRLNIAAQAGIHILTADFFADDAVQTDTYLDSGFLSNPVAKSLAVQINPAINASTQNALLRQKELELETLLALAKKSASSVFIVAEGTAKQAALNLLHSHLDFIAGIFDPTEDEILNAYYGRGIADRAFTQPFDAFIFSFKGFSGYKDFKNHRTFAKNQDVTAHFAELLAEKIQLSYKDNNNDSF